VAQDLAGEGASHNTRGRRAPLPLHCHGEVGGCEFNRPEKPDRLLPAAPLTNAALLHFQDGFGRGFVSLVCGLEGLIA
jgi:hypothetical protein